MACSINIDDKCRLCLEEIEENSKHPVFEKSLNYRIFLITNVQIDANDILPKNICTFCRYQLEKSFFFRAKAKQVQTLYRRHLKMVKAGEESNIFAEKTNIVFDDDEFEEQYMEACVSSDHLNNITNNHLTLNL